MQHSITQLNEATECRNLLRKESNTISKLKSGELKGGDVDKSLIEVISSLCISVYI